MHPSGTRWGNGRGRAQGECHRPLTECSLHLQCKESGKMTTRSEPLVFADTDTREPAAESTGCCIAVASLTFELSLRTRSSHPKKAGRFSTLAVGVDATAASRNNFSELVVSCSGTLELAYTETLEPCTRFAGPYSAAPLNCHYACDTVDQSVCQPSSHWAWTLTQRWHLAGHGDDDFVRSYSVTDTVGQKTPC